MEALTAVYAAFVDTALDVLPIVVILIGFQFLVLRRPLPTARRIVVGFVHVIVGLALFMVGLEQALFPLGRNMARQLTDFQAVDGGGPPDWMAYGWVYAFAAAIGFATTIAEPALIAVALKAERMSGGAIPARRLRVAVAIGVAAGVALGCFRIVTGYSIVYFILTGYAVVVVQTLLAPKMIVPLAYDSGGVSTSTVTVPVITALGLGLASAVPDRNPFVEGFGLIAFACLFPIMSVLAYASLADWWRRARNTDRQEPPG